MNIEVNALSAGTFNLIKEQEAFRAKLAKFEDKILDLGLELWNYQDENGDRCECPHCGVNLDNGIFVEGDQEINGEGNKERMYSCLGCGGEFGPKLKAKASRGIRENFSTIEKPTKKVWDIAERMEGAKRSDVIAACVAEGIAFNTARTQYQQWSQAKRGIIK